MTITVVYDNNACKEGLETGWGFSVVISGCEKTILFDTGPGRSLLGNMEKLAIEPNSIDTVVLSHIHPDHTGGLGSFLEKNSDVTVYLPESFPKKFKDKVQSSGAKIVEVRQSVKICEDVYSTGELGKLVKEQSLVIQTDKGLIVVAGCAHPGIVRIVNAANKLFKDDILLPAPPCLLPQTAKGVTQAQVVMGGFHLEWATKGKIKKIISAFGELGVRCVGLCHCCGDKARGLFEEHFGENYINVGAGKVITMADFILATENTERY